MKGVQRVQGVQGVQDKGILWRYCLALLVLMALPYHSFSQIAGINSLTVLDMSSSARSTGLGMDYLSLFDNDVTIGIDNPSMLHSGMSNTGTLTYISMFSSSMGSLSYAHHTERYGTFLFGFHFNSYGSFEGYDEEETSTGTFHAADYMLHIGWGMWIDSNFSIGVNFKPVLSQYEQYTAVAAVFDVAGSYTSSNRRFAATLMARNIGAQIVTFDQTVERLPFELSAEISYKLANAPFRVFFAATELQRWNLRYDDPLNPTTTTDPFTGEVQTESWLKGTIDNLMRHTLFGLELNIGKSLYARLGYSYRQTAETRGVDAFNLSGFSFGFGLRTKRFEFGFARRNYHLSQAPTYLTLSYKF